MGGHRASVSAAMVAAFAMIAQQVAGKATRDALFLSIFPARVLPQVMVLGALVSVAAVLLASRGLARFGPARLVPAAFLVSGLGFAAEWAFVPRAPGAIAWVVYLHMAAFGAIVISGFWSVVNEAFDPHSAKRKVARIATGATLGGVAGGVVAERAAVLLDVRSGLLVLATLNVIAALAVLRVGGRAGHVTSGDSVEGGLRVLRGSRYLQSLGLLVALVAISATLLDYAFKAHAQLHISQDHDLMRFFAAFYTATAVATFAVQSLFGQRALAKLGLSGTVALLPAAVILFGGAGAAIGRWGIIALAKGVETVLSNSLFRSGYELFYTPLAPEKKRPSKTIVDVGSERIGDALGGAITLAVLAITTVWAPTVVIGIAMLAAFIALWLARRLGKGYVAELATSLKTGAVRLDAKDVVDATTRKTLTETTMALDRERLLEEINQLRRSQGLTDPPPKLDVSDEHDGDSRSDSTNVPSHEALEEAFDDLLSGDAPRIRARLREEPDPRWAPLLIDLVARSDVRDVVHETLVALAPRITGQLVDALLDETRPFIVRRRIPRALMHGRALRAAEGLMDGLADRRFEVRYQCGRALARITRQDAGVRFPTTRVYTAVLRELDVDRKVWETQHLLDEEGDDSSPWLDGVLRVRLHRSVEHVFTLLSLALDHETLTLTLRALESDDKTLRGTALEYLENVLPDDVRKKLWPFLGQPMKKRAESRPRQQIVDDLLKSMDSIGIDREALRKETT